MKNFSKKIAKCIILMMVLSIMAVPSYGISFDVEKTYESVFVVYSGSSLATGFAVGENCIITNAHAIDNKNDIRIKAYSGKYYSTSLIAMDESQDIAILASEDADFPFLKIEAESVKTGDDIYAIGTPKSLDYTMTKGIVSSRSRKIDGAEYIQIDAALNEGNSGGPLLNANGNVVGLNTLKVIDSEGIGLSIPVSRVCKYIKKNGIKIKDNGNIDGKITIDNTKPDRTEDESSVKRDKEYKNNRGNTLLKALLIFSVAINIVLTICLMYQKRKNLIVKQDESERTDFEIEILE